MYQVWASAWVLIGASGGGGDGGGAGLRGLRLGEAASGVAQIDVVEGGAGHGGGGDRRTGPLQGGEQYGDGRGAVLGAHAHPAAVDQHLVHPGQSGERGGDGPGVAPGAQLHVDGVAPEFTLEFVGGALDDDPAAVDDRDAFGEPVGLLQVVRGEDDGQPLVVGQPGDLLPHRRTGLRVESGGGFVEEEHLGTVDQAERHVEASLHPSGVPLDLAVARVGEVEAVQQFVGAALHGRAPHPVQPALEQEVLPAGGDRVGAGLLGDHADGSADPVGVAQDVVSGDGRGAGVGAGQGGEDLDGGGLPGTVGAEQSEDRAGLDAEVHAAQGGDIAGIGLDQVSRRYGGRTGAVPRRCGRTGAHDRALLWVGVVLGCTEHSGMPSRSA